MTDFRGAVAILTENHLTPSRRTVIFPGAPVPRPGGWRRGRPWPDRTAVNGATGLSRPTRPPDHARMDSAETVHRIHFAFNAIYHYLFPQLTMGLALFVVLMKWAALRTGDEAWNRAARFWGKIFAVNFAFGVVTGIPLEFQFGTNWAGFSRMTGGVIGQTLALEGTFAFFLESTFLGLFLFGEKRLGPRKHLLVAVMLALGTWLSGFFIVSTNAWMQHPVGYSTGPDGRLHLESLFAMLTNEWAWWQFPHAILGAVTTASAVVAGVGAWYLLSRRHEAHGRRFVRLGVLVGLPAALLLGFPTGDAQAKLVHDHQPEAFAAMEGLFEGENGAGLVLIGQPDMQALRLDNPIEVPKVLSFLTHGRWNAEIKGLKDLPRDRWPQNIPLLYYAYHLMVGIGTILVALFGLAALRLRRGRLYASRPLLWSLLLAIPLPYIANTTGWMTAELGRQPWVVHGILRTRDAFSKNVSAGNALFTLIGFAGIYVILSILFAFLVGRKIIAGPDADAGPAAPPSPVAPHPEP